ncbi:MAG: TerB family tellurite resistance protein [Cyclobacteriaceae bacterium]|nr:TerB family tellurite resistance protein [Cyclobacteriaceae bacterium]
MIGFFEYQYLKFKKNHLRNLVAMAAIDGHIHEEEIAYLYKIGEKYQLKPQQIKHILDTQEKPVPEVPEHHHQKIALLYDLVGMMMADEVIEDAEMEFCKNMFERFGYKEQLIDEMIELYRQGVEDTDQWEDFLGRAEVHRLNLADW